MTAEGIVTDDFVRAMVFRYLRETAGATREIDWLALRVVLMETSRATLRSGDAKK